jgi:type IV secretion system protein VirB10
MTEEANIPEQETPASHPAKLRDRRNRPEGVVPKQSQAYVIAGLAILILLAVMFSKQHPKPAAKTAASASTPPAELNERKIADLKEELNTAQRESEQAARPANGALTNTSPGTVGAGAIAPQTVGAQPLPAQDAHRDPIADAEKEIAFKSRFSSNLVTDMVAGSLPPDGGLPNRAMGRETNGEMGGESSTNTVGAGSPSAVPAAGAAANQSKRAPEVNANSAVGQPFVLFEGTTIDTALVNHLNGDFSGPVKVMVTNPVSLETSSAPLTQGGSGK